MRKLLIRLHRYLSLAALAIWLVQALTGVLNVYHRELGDAALGVSDAPVDIAALGAGIERLEATRARVSSVYAGGGMEGQFDVFVRDEAGATRVVRVGVQGQPLRERPWAASLEEAGLLQTSRIIHETLLAGDAGLTLIGVSGILLLTNLALGLRLAWPKRGTWRRALWPARAPHAAATVYAWHRAAGLWFALPAIVFVTAGVLTAFGGPLERWLGPVAPEPRVASTDAASLLRAVSPEEALRIALARYPDARLSILSLPDALTPWYRIRLLQPGESRRVYGNTTLYVHKATGAVLADYDAFALPWRVQLLNAFYAIHTGEWFGPAGRAVAFLTGLALVALFALGPSLWWLRRRVRSRAPTIAPQPAVR